MKRVCFFCVYIFFSISSLLGQSSLSDFASLKNFTPPSPDVSAIAKYGDVPVSLSVGIPNIAIPIFNIKTKNLELPVSLSYHAGGVKVEDIASVVGLGWSLQAGGVISRNVVSLPDESAAGFLSGVANFTKDRQYFEGKEYSGVDVEYLTNLSGSVWDSQSDIYNFTIPGLSGKMVYDINGTLHHTPLDKNLKISRDPNGWVIKDDNGNSYYFSQTESTFNQQAQRPADVTAWHLVRIVSADLTDTIEFNYVSAQTVSEEMESYSYSVNMTADPNVGICNPNGPLEQSFVKTANTYQYNRVLLQSINFNQGKIEFDYLTDRQDPGKERLTSVKILSKDAELVKKYDLIHSYFVTGTDYNIDLKYGKRLKLNKVIVRNSDLTEEGDYQLEYNETPFPPYYTSFSGISRTTSVDYWGYNKLNGGISAYGIKTLLPRSAANNLGVYLNSTGSLGGSIYNNYNQYYSCNRSVDPTAVFSGILTKIIYSTGGITHFEYEPNRTTIVREGNDFTGGVRIKRIASYSGGNSKPVIKTYTYNNNTGQGYPMAANLPDEYSYENKRFQTCSMYSNLFYRLRDYKIVANPVSRIRLHEGSPVFYPQVTEYNGYPGVNEGKVDYTFELKGDYVPSRPDNMKYWNFSTDRSWARGMPLTTKIYKAQNNNYVLQKETRNTYTILKPLLVKTGYLCEQMTTFNGTNLSVFLNTPLIQLYEKKLLYHFEFIDVDVSIGVKKLTKIEEFIYENSNMNKTTHYTYGSTNHLYPSIIEETTSKSEINKTIIKYTQDHLQIGGLSGTSSAALNEMINLNIVSVPIETSVLTNNALLYKNRTDFKIYGLNRVYPEFDLQAVKTNPIEQRIAYKAYNNNGSLATLAQVNNNDHSYLWNDFGEYVTAKAENANANEIGFTDFEPYNKGGWNITGSGFTNNSFWSGKTSFNLSNGQISKSGLQVGKDYIVSYWASTGTALVNSLPGTAIVTKGSWTRYQHTINSGTVSLSGNTVIDDLKVYPKNATIVTYTHKPLIGVVSVSDMNDQILFYSYDNSGKLRKITDMDGNVIKLFQYETSLDKVASSWTPQQSMIPSWNMIGSRCILDGMGGNTGDVEYEYEDINIYSTSYKNRKWVFIGRNTSICPPACNSCKGPNQSCINNQCEIGIRVDTYSYFNPSDGMWHCIYHYEFSDGSWSVSYEDISSEGCPMSN